MLVNQKKWEDINLPESKSFTYACPNCGTYHNDNEDGYLLNGVKYPLIKNERKGSTLDGNYHDWEEIHQCEDCKTEYYFTNGVY